MKLNDKWYGQVLFAVIAASALAAPACSSSDKKQTGADAGANDAGAGGQATGAGGSAGSSTGGASTGAGGSAGSSTGGGSTGTGGARAYVDASTDASDGATVTQPDDAGPSAASTLCAGASRPDAGTAPHVLLVAGTDYVTTTETAAIDLDHGCVLGRSSVADGDAIAATSSGRGFTLERSNGALDVLAANGAVETRIDLHTDDGGPTYLDPHAVVVPGPGSTKAYVALFGGDGIAVVDLAGKADAHTIDLSSMVASNDADGSADADGGFYDAATGRVDFVLERIDQTTIAPPNYELACPTVPAELIAIDPASDSLIDLNGASAGVGIDLTLVAPTDIAVDATNRTLYLADNGCFAGPDGGAVRVHHGVEAVNLDTLQARVVYAPTTQDLVNGLVLLGSDSSALDTYDTLYVEHWTLLDTTTGTLGAALAGVPQGAVAESPGSIRRRQRRGPGARGGRPLFRRDADLDDCNRASLVDARHGCVEHRGPPVTR